MSTPTPTQFLPTVVASHSHVLRLRILVPLAAALTFYLYLFPVFHGCAFPLPSPHARPVPNDTNTTAAANVTALDAFLEAAASHLPPSLRAPSKHPSAPFRLLALGDPQLEGDTSIPNYYGPRLPHLWDVLADVTFQSSHPSLRERIRKALHNSIDIFLEDVPFFFEAVRKTIDLWGNDYYLGHNFRTLHWWTRPTHVTVLGDLLGSQWIDDKEFDRRGWRFWNKVMRGVERVPDEVAIWPVEESEFTGIVGADDAAAKVWTMRSINVAGNHDIGYAGDLNEDRLARFERMFGKANYELRFELPITDPAVNATIIDPETNPTSTRVPPEIRIVVLNDMNLDTPAISQPLQDATYQFINAVIDTSTAVEYDGVFTILLTHVPLYKRAGICVDPPFFDFFESWEGGGVREQNQLSLDASKGILEGMYGLSGNPDAAGGGRGRRGIVLNGHDHEGCDTYHFINQSVPAENRTWEALPWEQARARDDILGVKGLPGIHEITARSMMGDFGGFMGMLSVWFDEDSWEWKHEFTTCAMGTQYGWWFVHLVDLIVVLVILARCGQSVGLDLGALVTGLEKGLDWIWEMGERGVDWAVETGAEKWRARKARKVKAKAVEVGKTNGSARS